MNKKLKDDLERGEELAKWLLDYGMQDNKWSESQSALIRRLIAQLKSKMMPDMKKKAE